MRRKLAFVGIVLLSIVIVVLVFSAWQIPLQEQTYDVPPSAEQEPDDVPKNEEQEAYDIPHSEVVLHETFVEPTDGETVRPINLTIWDQLHIYYSGWGLGYGHYGDVRLLVLDEANYLKRKAGEPYEKLFGTHTARYNQYCLITHNGTWYFVWDNTFKSSRDSQLSPIEVYTEITRNWNDTAYRDITVNHTIVPNAYSTSVEYSGIALTVTSVAVTIWGIVFKEKREADSTTE